MAKEIRELEKILKRKTKYWLGPIKDVHYIAEFAFVEYAERDFSSGATPRGKLTGEHNFSIFINGRSISLSANSLDEAIVAALAYKYDGHNSQAARFFSLMIGMPETHQDYARYVREATESADA